MRKLFLAAGVAALAISAPATADRGKNEGGKGGDRRAAKVERGGGGGGHKVERAGGERRFRAERRGGEERRFRAERRGGEERRFERRGGGENRMFRAERRDRDNDRRFERRGGGERRFAAFRDREDRRGDRAEKAREGRKWIRQDRERRFERAERREERRFKQARKMREERFEDGRKAREQAFKRAQKRNERMFEDRRRLADRRDWRGERDEDRRIRFRDRDFVQHLFRDDADRWVSNRASGFAGDCPPGLRFKNPYCMPPGQYRQRIVGSRLPVAYASGQVPYDLRHLYYDTDDYYHRYGDGYLYRVDRETSLVRSLLPLFGLGLGVGQPFPASYANHYVPSYYQPFYRETNDDYYRYSNGYVYEIDRDSGLIEDIIPMYDHGYGVGQMLPASYSYYNLPDPYRSYYADSPDHFYRYAPGAIYRVDRETQLITSIVSLLTGTNALTIGQQLPAGYSAYNVPYGYRDLYYDTPDNWYRYSNGSIYQVDPATQLVTAVVSMLTGGLGIGQQFPYAFNSPDYYVPAHYQSFYPDTADDYYRYNDGYVYEIDRHSGLIEDVIPMYDHGYGVGQVLPASYGYYNVPDPYRDYYVEDDENFYRYAPGAIYQVDRDTRQITSIASLLMANDALAIGQPLPPGYSAYNVPYAYRDRYYDRPNAWYRYSNGHIYQVDPATRLITAIIEAIV